MHGQQNINKIVIEIVSSRRFVVQMSAASGVNCVWTLLV